MLLPGARYGAGKMFSHEPAEREPLEAIRSEITDGMNNDERSLAWLQRNTPLPYQGSVDDFVGAVLWLVGDAGRYVTGQTIVVDGGWTAH